MSTRAKSKMSGPCDTQAAAAAAAETSKRSAPPRKWRLLVALALALLATSERIGAEPGVQPRLKSQPSNELTQDLFLSSETGPVGGPLMGLGRGAFASSKRARKMSAFVPMRGRKDGRDFQQQARELDYGEPSLWRAAAGPSGGDEPSRGLYLMGANSVPRQFIEQLEQLRAAAAAAAATSQQRQHRNVQAPSSGLRSLNAGRSSGRESVASLLPVDLEEPNNLIESKFRRAFHPMRGKRLGTLATMDDELVGGAGLDSGLWEAAGSAGQDEVRMEM